MKSSSGDAALERLRRQVEVAFRRSRSRNEIERLLTELLEIANPDSEAALFARRHLAELLLETKPWCAALHLRHVVRKRPEDDVVHALLGLCHALLGNFRLAVNAYRKALLIAPKNPWYHHNLGHMIDVALGLPAKAEKHLWAAHQCEPREHEITASLAHCLARQGKLEQAEALAKAAVAEAPKNREHKALLDWICDGANVPKRVRRAPRKRVKDASTAGQKLEG